MAKKKNKKQRRNDFDMIFEDEKKSKKVVKKEAGSKTIKGEIVVEQSPLEYMKDLLKASNPITKMTWDGIADLPSNAGEYTIDELDVDSVGKKSSTTNAVELPDDGLVTIQFKKGDGTIVSYSEEDLVNEEVDDSIKSKLIKVGVGCLVAAGVVLGFRATDLKL
jgi:hypothetical protein